MFSIFRIVGKIFEEVLIFLLNIGSCDVAIVCDDLEHLLHVNVLDFVRNCELANVLDLAEY